MWIPWARATASGRSDPESTMMPTGRRTALPRAIRAASNWASMSSALCATTVPSVAQ